MTSPDVSAPRALPPVSASRPSQNSTTSARHEADEDREDRTRCLDCLGSGCPACTHSGQVCPVCRGMRFVRTREWSSAQPFPTQDKPDIARCGACCEGNQVNPDKENRVIMAYLARHGYAQRVTVREVGGD